MPSLQVRNLPEEIYDRLRRDARKEHRSLSQQVVVTLKKGLAIQEHPKERRRKLIEKIAKDHREEISAELPDPVVLVREDRDKG